MTGETDPFEDIAEVILCSTAPGGPMFDSAQTDFACQDAALACAGMPRVWYLALLNRILHDDSAARELYARLAALALSDPRRAVRRRAGLLARLVLAEDRGSGLLEKVGLIPPLLECSKSGYYRDVRQSHLDLRARLDSWARSGYVWIVKRCR